MLAQDYTNYKGSNYKFKKINLYDATPVESQGRTGTCWSFSALSFLESEMIRMGKKNVQPLSEMFIVRKAYEMKAEKYIRMDGKTNFGEGGAFHDIPIVIKKYGIVPREFYTGKAEDGTYNHGELYKVLNDYLENIMLNQVGKPQGIDLNWKKGVNGILDKYLGEVPQYVQIEGEKKVPLIDFAFAQGLNVDNYVSLTSFSNHEFYEECMLEIPDNWAWGKSYNIPLEDLIKTAEYALSNGYTMAWGADVSEQGFNFRKGLAIVPANGDKIEVIGKDKKNFNDAGADKNSDIILNTTNELQISQEFRQTAYDNKTTTDDHEIHFLEEIEGKDKKNFNDSGADKNSDVFLNPTKELQISQEFRQTAYDNKTTTDDHGMHITGLFEDQNGTKYFYVKNSWGNKNYPEGYLYVSENYFRYKTINIFLHKDAISNDLKKKLNL